MILQITKRFNNMKIKLVDVDHKELIPDHIGIWYDRKQRLYIIQLLTEEGYQIGDAIYVPNKDNAMIEATLLRDEVNKEYNKLVNITKV